MYTANLVTLCIILNTEMYLDNNSTHCKRPKLILETKYQAFILRNDLRYTFSHNKFVYEMK